jgi:hypothetical protein
MSIPTLIQSESLVPSEGYVLVRFIANAEAKKLDSKPGIISDPTKPEPIRIMIENSVLDQYRSSIERGEFVDTYIPCRISYSETEESSVDIL